MPYGTRYGRTPSFGVFLNRWAFNRNGHGLALADAGIDTIVDLDTILEDGWSLMVDGEGVVYRDGHIVHLEGVLVTPTSPSQGDRILLFPYDLQPASDTYFAVFDIDGSGEAILKADASSGDLQWWAGTHGAGVNLTLSGCIFLDPYGTR